MLSLTPEQKNELAKKRLEENLPFFIKALKVDLGKEDLVLLATRLSHEYNIIVSENGLAMIFGMFDEKDCSYPQRWAEFVRVCNKFLNSHYYIPFKDDVVAPVGLLPNNPHYIQVAKSKIYFSGFIAKRLLTEAETNQVKESLNVKALETH